MTGSFYKHPLVYQGLAPCEQQKLFRRARKGSKAAIRKIMEHYLLFAAKEGRRAARPYSVFLNLDDGDVVGEANIGLQRAAARYKMNQGSRFAPYAREFIRGKVRVAARKAFLARLGCISLHLVPGVEGVPGRLPPSLVVHPFDDWMERQEKIEQVQALQKLPWKPKERVWLKLLLQVPQAEAARRQGTTREWARRMFLHIARRARFLLDVQQKQCYLRNQNETVIRQSRLPGSGIHHRRWAGRALQSGPGERESRPSDADCTRAPHGQAGARRQAHHVQRPRRKLQHQCPHRGGRVGSKHGRV